MRLVNEEVHIISIRQLPVLQSFYSSKKYFTYPKEVRSVDKAFRGNMKNHAT